MRGGRHPAAARLTPPALTGQVASPPDHAPRQAGADSGQAHGRAQAEDAGGHPARPIHGAGMRVAAYGTPKGGSFGSATSRGSAAGRALGGIPGISPSLAGSWRSSLNLL